MGRNLEIRSLNCRPLTTTDMPLCWGKNRSFLDQSPSICVFVEVNQNNLCLQSLNHYFRYKLRYYNLILHENKVTQQPGIIVLINKSCHLKLVYKEEIDPNCLNLSLRYEDTTYGIFCTYEPSKRRDTNFLYNLRRNQLNSTEDHTAIIGDLNCTVDPVMDKVGYTADHHWHCREVIKE